MHLLYLVLSIMLAMGGYFADISAVKTPPKDPLDNYSPDLLKALHILTRDGALNQDSRRKLKQVEHLLQLIIPLLGESKSFVDLGAGKSYLGFLLYDRWLKSHADSRLWAVEQRPELIRSGQELAQKMVIERMQFVDAAIEHAAERENIPEQVDVVTALHACDTATDDALIFALQKKAKVIAVVPCCQAEAARLLTEHNKVHSSEVGSLWAHPLHRREFGSHLTNVFRALVLESLGYRVRVTELVGWEHSLKNEIILAEKIQNKNGVAARELSQLREKFPLPLKIFSVLSP